MRFALTTINKTSKMKSYHVMTACDKELFRPGFDTLSEAIGMASEFCADTLRLYGEAMELYVECHDGKRKRRVAVVLHMVKAVMLDDVEE